MFSECHRYYEETFLYTAMKFSISCLLGVVMVQQVAGYFLKIYLSKTMHPGPCIHYNFPKVITSILNMHGHILHIMLAHICFHLAWCSLSWNSCLTSSIKTVFEIVLSALKDIRSTNELTFGGPVLIVVDRRNMQ